MWNKRMGVNNVREKEMLKEMKSGKSAWLDKANIKFHKKL